MVEPELTKKPHYRGFFVAESYCLVFVHLDSHGEEGAVYKNQ